MLSLSLFADEETEDLRCQRIDEAIKWSWDLNPGNMNGHAAIWPTCCLTSWILQSGGVMGE